MKNLTWSLVLTLAVAGLTCSGAAGAEVMLRWTNTYDDGMVVASGPVTGWELRTSTLGPVTDSSWADAMVLATKSPIDAAAGGQPDSVLVQGLQANTTYWFAIKAYDEAFNWATVSNPFSITTPDAVQPAAVIDLGGELR